MKINGTLYPYQMEAVMFLIGDGKELNNKKLLALGMGLGKGLDLNVKICCSKGWVRNGDLKLGDIVCSPDGGTAKVTGIFPQGIKQTYEVNFKDGSSTLCDEEHLWLVQSPRDKNRKLNENWKIMSVKELLKAGLVEKSGNFKYYIPMTKSVNFESQDLKVNPYILGVLLGDGYIGKTIRIDTDEEIIDNIKNIYKTYKSKRKGCCHGSVSQSNKEFYDEIKNLGLLGKRSWEKFVPKKYLFNSIENRLAILQGLLDTDGGVSDGIILEYSSTSEQLAMDIQFLVQSFGGKAIISEKKEPKYTYKGESRIGRKAYRVNISLPKEIIPFRLERKRKAYTPRSKYQPTRAIVSIIPKDMRETQCISVSSKRNLYIVDNFIVTHNTAISLAFSAYTEKQRILVVCPSSVKWSWRSEVKLWTPFYKSLVVDSNTKLDKKVFKKYNIFITNYEILKKHYEALSEAGFDCMIVDESSYCKNPRAIRTKAVSMLAKKIKNVVLMSGTPILNRPIELFPTLNIIDPMAWHNYYSFAYKYCGAKTTHWGLDVNGATNIEELRTRLSKVMYRKTKEDVLTDLPKLNFIDVPVELDAETRVQYKLLEDDFITYLQDVKNKEDDEIEKSLMAEQLVKLGEMRMLTACGKIEQAKEVIQNIIDSGEKVVVFSSYNEPLVKLHNHFNKSSVIIIGSTKDTDRGKAVENFQNDDNIKVFLGGMLSANTGITLTAACNVLFINHDWVPANMAQAYSRIDRLGQKAKNLFIYQLYAMETIDQRMTEILKTKQIIFDKLIDGKDTVIENSSSMIKDIIKSYK